MDQLRRPLNRALLGILAVATVAGLILIPTDAQVPVRWSLDFQVTQTMSKVPALLQMPIATTAVWAIVWAIRRYGNAERHAGQARVLALALPVLTALFALVQVAIVVIAR